ncbi:MAG: ATP-dependent helicase [Deltaproteobacteria bacterium]|jgi:DNA helicase-2/ATP-dependent DNA helicase PcrA|nr:ATP-dependent helicase [Deltaproteobacteria bacterium]
MKGPDFQALLNPSQYRAVTYAGGPLLIVAGAGSGKTRTLVHRVAWLVSQGVNPAEILLLTFTRKAAQEMLDRCARLVGPEAGKVAGGTFHALANLLLRRHAPLLGYPASFGIMDQDDSANMLAKLKESLPADSKGKKFPKKAGLYSIVSQAASREKSVSEIVETKFPHFREVKREMEELADLYERQKRASAVMDFDDLLRNLAKILGQDEETRERIAGRYSHVLVDEYQDTNPVQARIAWQLGRDSGRVTAVGDEAQSIYSFRGADYQNILNFPTLFPNAAVLKLEENYRSVQPVLAVANAVLRGAPASFEKNLRAVREGGAKPVLKDTEDVTAEAEFVGERIAELLGEGVSPTRVAVLFRASSHSFELEFKLIKERIPFTKYGGRKFMERSHVKDFLSFLRLAVNPRDSLSLARILELHEGIGSKGAESVAAWVGGERENFMRLAEAPFKGKGKSAAQDLQDLFGIISRDGAEIGNCLASVFEYYEPFLERLYPDDSRERRNELQEFLSMSQGYGSLESFLADLTLDPPSDQKSQSFRRGARQDLTLSTIHGAKGLEWDYVFLLSAVEGRFPSSYVSQDDEAEEERRLLYVAVTRAKDELYITRPLMVSTFEGWMDTRLNRHLAEVPRELFDRLGKRRGVPAAPGPKPSAGAARSRREGAMEAAPGKLSVDLPPREKILELRKGDKVTHVTFGNGVVVSSRDGAALVNFDSFGRKNIVFKHSPHCLSRR